MTEVKRQSLSPKKVSIADKVRHAFAAASHGSKGHGRALPECQQAHATDDAKFWDIFVECVERVLIVYKKDTAVESSVKFIVLLGTRVTADVAARDEFTSRLLMYVVLLLLAIAKFKT